MCLGSTWHTYIAKNTDAEAIKCAGIEVYKAGRAPLDMNATPVSTKGATSVKLIGMAEKATTAEPKALEPRAEGEVWYGLDMLLPLL